MELSDAVAADLAVLTAALDEPDDDLALLVLRLSDSCALAVKSYLGLSITLIVGDAPVSFSVLQEFLEPSEVLTSVMFSLTAVGEHTSGSEVVLYGGTPGAFVDLAADLTYALGAGEDAVKLDQHLTPPDLALGDAGLAATSRQDQALGILLDQGLDLDEGLTELHRLAGLDAISVDTAAQELIDAPVQLPPA
ncbi:MAG: hypothetical protein M3N95_06780 [Actinomycetota bacterium]|nr:hypothetical protein [Actinomycetota bacterium]